ncbi:hypothetical protein AGMMS49982_19570 [Bacteroidia bacterium]|nr:hypothetical protein AGMMS49982_19570 [Bacteroidia bacterium]
MGNKKLTPLELLKRQEARLLADANALTVDIKDNWGYLCSHPGPLLAGAAKDAVHAAVGAAGPAIISFLVEQAIKRLWK